MSDRERRHAPTWRCPACWGSVLRERNATQVQIVGFLVLGTGTVAAGTGCRAQCGDESEAHSRGDLLVHGEAVGGGDLYLIAPQGAVGIHVDCFQGDCQLTAFGQVVPGDDGADTHGSTSLLEIDAGSVVFAGGGKGTNGERLYATQRGGYFIGQG